MAKKLILIPCCSLKTVERSEGGTPPLPGLQEARNELIGKLRTSPAIAGLSKNIVGVLGENPIPTRCSRLYSGMTGGLHDLAKPVISRIQKGDLPELDIIVVSALYGLVTLDEAIFTYDLTMAKKLSDIKGDSPYNFWKRKGIWKTLSNYVASQSITEVWSFLPHSQQFPYHNVFTDYWTKTRNGPITCRHLIPVGAKSNSGSLRGTWLAKNADDLAHGKSFVMALNGTTFTANRC